MIDQAKKLHKEANEIRDAANLDSLVLSFSINLVFIKSYSEEQFKIFTGLAFLRGINIKHVRNNVYELTY